MARHCRLAIAKCASYRNQGNYSGLGAGIVVGSMPLIEGFEIVPLVALRPRGDKEKPPNIGRHARSGYSGWTARDPGRSNSVAEVSCSVPTYGDTVIFLLALDAG